MHAPDILPGHGAIEQSDVAALGAEITLDQGDITAKAPADGHRLLDELRGIPVLPGHEHRPEARSAAC